jgi:hypothetical protein
MEHAQRAARAWAGLATAVAGLSAVAVFGLAGPAAADVSIDSEQGQRSGGARIAFRVTNESPTASITKVEVRFPGNVRIPEIYPIAVADWAPSITMTKVDNNPANDVPSSVVWVTMPGREIKPGATSVLPLAMGPMPDIDTVYLDVVQTRSDGSIVTWAGVDVPAAGAQHPAFALKLVPLQPGQVPEHGHGGAAAADQPQTDAAAEEPDTAEGSSAVRLVMVLLLIVAVTGFALFWQRRRGAPSAAEDVSQDVDEGTTAPAATGEVDEPAPVRRRSVVRPTAARTAAERRAAARKSTGGAATATIARRRENAPKRARNTEGNNA